MRRVASVGLALSLLAGAGAARADVDGDTLIEGCSDGSDGPALSGWCHDEAFIGPAFLGTIFFTSTRDMQIYGLGQIGVVNVAEAWSGLLRIGAFNGADEMSGLDIAAVSYLGESYGLQLSLASMADEFGGFQLGGVFALAEEGGGIQIAPVSIVGDRFYGIQIGAFVARSEDVMGLQIAAVNLTKSWSTGQLGVVNYAGNHLRGVQVGVVNTVDESEGVQIGVFNYANTLHGLQLGVFNVAANDGLPFMVVANAGF
jgi:hypothetical protein